MDEVVQSQLLERIDVLQKHVAGGKDEDKILPRLDNLRAAIGEMTSRYDARLSEVKDRNQHALSELQKLAGRLQRVKEARESSEARAEEECERKSSVCDSQETVPQHGASLDRWDEIGCELGAPEYSEYSVMSPEYMCPAPSPAYWSTGEYSPAVLDLEDMTPPDRPPPVAPAPVPHVEVQGSGMRTPSPEWSPRVGSLLRRMPYAFPR